jgi:hypothetical protein
MTAGLPTSAPFLGRSRAVPRGRLLEDHPNVVACARVEPPLLRGKPFTYELLRQAQSFEGELNGPEHCVAVVIPVVLRLVLKPGETPVRDRRERIGCLKMTWPILGYGRPSATTGRVPSLNCGSRIGFSGSSSLFSLLRPLFLKARDLLAPLLCIACTLIRDLRPPFDLRGVKVPRLGHPDGPTATGAR